MEFVFPRCILRSYFAVSSRRWTIILVKSGLEFVNKRMSSAKRKLESGLSESSMTISKYWPDLLRFDLIVERRELEDEIEFVFESRVIRSSILSTFSRKDGIRSVSLLLFSSYIVDIRSWNYDDTHVSHRYRAKSKDFAFSWEVIIRIVM